MAHELDLIVNFENIIENVKGNLELVLGVQLVSSKVFNLEALLRVYHRHQTLYEKLDLKLLDQSTILLYFEKVVDLEHVFHFTLWNFKNALFGVPDDETMQVTLCASIYGYTYLDSTT